MAGKYLCAETGGGSILVANRTVVSSWETFKVNFCFCFCLFFLFFLSKNTNKILSNFYNFSVFSYCCGEVVEDQ